MRENMESFARAMSGSILPILPEVARWVILALAIFCYILQPRFSFRIRFFRGACYRLLSLVTLLFFTLCAAIQTWIQYFAWSADPLSSKLLPPYQPWTRFALYALQRHWLGFFIGIALAVVFFLFLKVLQRYRERFFEVGETELGFVLALVVGWPHFVLFLPIALFAVIFISIIRGIFLKQAYTTLGAPLLLAAAVTLFWSEELFVLFNLSALQVCLGCGVIR